MLILHPPLLLLGLCSSMRVLCAAVHVMACWMPNAVLWPENGLAISWHASLVLEGAA